MSASWKIANVIVLPLSLALATAGCVSPVDELASEEDEAVVAEADQAVNDATDVEAVGAAEQACGFGGGFGGYGGWGRGFGGFGGGFRPWGGCGFGLGRPFWGGGGGGCW